MRVHYPSLSSSTNASQALRAETSTTYNHVIRHRQTAQKKIDYHQRIQKKIS